VAPKKPRTRNKYNESHVARIAELAAQGLTRAKIADTMGIPEGSVATMVRNNQIKMLTKPGMPRSDKPKPPKKARGRPRVENPVHHAGYSPDQKQYYTKVGAPLVGNKTAIELATKRWV